MATVYNLAALLYVLKKAVLRAIILVYAFHHLNPDQVVERRT